MTNPYETPATEPLAARPTRIRYLVVAMAVLLAMVTYLDRACISVLKPDIMGDLGLSEKQMGWVFSAFALAYAIFEIPTAWWADRTGTRQVLTRIVVWWSAFTIATAGAFNYVSLLVMRFLFGVGEAGAWPSRRADLLPLDPAPRARHGAGHLLRGRASGRRRDAAAGAGLLTQYRRLAGDLRDLRHAGLRLGRRLVRLVPRRSRRAPAGQRGGTAADRRRAAARRRAHAPAGPTGGGCSATATCWALCLMYFPNSFAFYFCITWLPTYLKEKHGFEADVAGLFCRAAADAERAGRSVRRRDDRLGRGAFGLRWGRVRRGRRGLPGRRAAHDPGRGVAHGADAGRDA